MESIITMPVKGFTAMRSPYLLENAPQKFRFFVKIGDVSAKLLDWMSTNPREQNLGSTVAKTIASSIREDHKEFHLRNRGVLLSAKELEYSIAPETGSGSVNIILETDGLHGNIDGGHTLRLILAAQEERIPLPEQYVEFEVITGLTSAVDIAEARNTSVALDIRTLEEMRGSYDVLKSVLGDVVIGEDRFFDRVEFKMNQQLEEQNKIDIRNIISMLLMFNVDLYPNKDEGPVRMIPEPVEMYGGKESALKKYLALGGGDPEKRDECLRKMAPVLADIIRLYDIIERELPLVQEKKYKAMPFAGRRKAPKGLFSNAPLPYFVPQSIVFPVLSGFRVLIQVDEDSGMYGWAMDPFLAWENSKAHMANQVINELKTFKNNPNTIVKNKMLWRGMFMSVELVMMEHKYGKLK